MVIQGFNVNVSSQRTFTSVQPTGFTAESSQNSASFALSMSKHTNTAKIPEQAEKQQNQSKNDQGQNQNGQGQNNGNNGNIGNGQLTNGDGNNQGKIGNGQLQNGNGNNGQGQNNNNQGQGNGDINTVLEKARDEAISRLSRRGSASRSLGAMHSQHHKMPTTQQELRARFAQMIYELLTGRFPKIKQKQHQHPEHHPSENVNEGSGLNAFSFFGGIFGTGSMQQLQQLQGIEGVDFHLESETVSYQANGVVHTADGRTITVDVSMHMSRQFVSFMGLPGSGGTLVDPLVINYGGTAASLTGEKFQFDLTMDGNMDSLSILGEGSGFLAIDKNGDGKINDGSELFGPSTGCGFSELRKYDTDGNGWIDANDEIFDKLVVWKRDSNGNDIVKTLKELGIGAIFLGDISTEFSFKDETNETLGVMRSTSFFLKNCGGAGTLSHIDLAL